jgi:hypothetical protein
MRNFNHTVNVLVQAYFNDTLQHYNCHACAVGNIVADACNFSYKPNPQADVLQKIIWTHKDKYHTKDRNTASWYTIVGDKCSSEEGFRQITMTGYSVLELTEIESAFEKVTGFNAEELMFNGLMAVVEVLSKIHGINLEEKEQAKKLFVKA